MQSIRPSLSLQIVGVLHRGLSGVLWPAGVASERIRRIRVGIANRAHNRRVHGIAFHEKLLLSLLNIRCADWPSYIHGKEEWG